MVRVVANDRIEVLLSKSSTRQGFFKLIEAVLDDDMNARCAEIVFDFQRVEALGCRAIVVLSNLIELLRQAGVAVSFVNFRQCGPATLLRQSGFFERYFRNNPNGRAETTKAMLPLELVDYARSHAYIQNRLTPWLEAVLDAPEGSVAAIDVCMKEIFNNIVDHSTVNVGSSIAYLEPRTGRIEICASDFGIGIPANVRTKRPELSDHEAVEMACTEGFTTKSNPRNRGAGLAILMQNVVDRNAGRVLLYSRRGFVSRSALPSTPPRECVLTKVGYPGTLVHITLNPSTFQTENVEEVFEW